MFLEDTDDIETVAEILWLVKKSKPVYKPLLINKHNSNHF